MPITHSNSDLAPEKLSRKESSELDYGSCAGSGLRDPGGTNSNGTLNTLTEGTNNQNGGGGGHSEPGDVEFSEACLNSVKRFFRNKGICGLEDCFWISFLVNVIVFLVVKAVTRHTFTQLFYMWLGACAALIALYCLAAALNKFVLEDSSTAHWNAHARFTQAAIQERLKEEEMRVHVIAPPKMGGAKLNILYTVGDVPLARDNSGRSTSGRPSSGSLGLPGSSSSGTPTTVLATTALIAPAALSSAVAGIASTPNSPPQPQPSTSVASGTSQTTVKTPPLKAALKPGGLEAIADASEPSTSSSTSSSISSALGKSTGGGGAGGGGGVGIKSTSTVQAALLPETIDEESDDRIESPVDDIALEERKSLLSEEEKK